MDNLAVDVGAGYTKYCNNEENAFKSVVCKKPTAPGFNINAPAEVTVDSETYFIGEDAEAYARPEERYNTIDDDFILSDPWKALFYSALAKAGVKADVDEDAEIRVVTGLPQSHWQAYKDDMLKFLNKTHEFTYKERDYAVAIKGWVIPQAAGALFYQAFRDNALLRDSVGVIDVGTYTTGFSVIEHQRFIPYRSNGVSVGIYQLLKALQEQLKRTPGYEVDYNKLHEGLLNRSFTFRGQDVDLNDAIEQCAQAVVRPIQDKLNEYWGAGDDLRVFVAGGGAPYFYNTLKMAVPHAELMEDSFFAVVRGMHSYLKAQK